MLLVYLLTLYMITCKLPQALVNYEMFALNNPMFSRGANLSGSEVTKVAVQNGLNGEFTRVNCEKLRSEFTKERNTKV